MSFKLIMFFFSLQKYYHGESLAVNVLVDNNTNKSVKKIKISGKFIIRYEFVNRDVTGNSNVATGRWLQEGDDGGYRKGLRF